MKSYSTYSVDIQNQGLTVEQYLKSVIQLSGRKIQKLTRQKGILLNKKPVFLEKKVKSGDVISVLTLGDQSYGLTPQNGPVDILFEDDQLIILNKQAHVLVHPAGQTNQGTLANYLAGYFQAKEVMLTIRPLHRLDRDTTGCVVFTKDAFTQTLLEQQLQAGELKRTYVAIIQGNIEPPEGTINEPIGPHPSKPNRRAVMKNGNPVQGDPAVTHYRTIQSLKGISLVEVTLETGRTHQIRVHLAHVGHPIIGDRMYGKGSPLIGRQALHAASVRFTHPKGQHEVLITAPLPQDMEMILDKR